MKKRLFIWGGAGILLLLLSIIVSLSMGSAHIPIGEVWSIIWRQFSMSITQLWQDIWSFLVQTVTGDPVVREAIMPVPPTPYEQIVMQVRFPRVVLAILVGAALSIAGAGFQGVLRNPLADPYTLGVASGASLGAAFMISSGLQYVLFGNWTVPLAAFVTGLISLVIVIRLASINGKFRTETMILAGVVVQAFFGAIVSLIISLSDTVMNGIIFWTMGSLQLRGWPYILVLAPYLLLGGIVLFSLTRSLNLFALGERQASHLGVHVERTKMIVLVTGTLLSAAAVSVAGTIGFVGLVTPHLMRLLVGSDYRLLLPLSAIYGGIYVLWADTIARTLLSPIELPLGVVTAFIGAPFFAWLLVRHKRKGAAQDG